MPAVSTSTPCWAAYAAIALTAAAFGSFVVDAVPGCDELDREHGADPAHVADDVVLLLQRRAGPACRALSMRRALGEQVVALDLLEHGDRGGGGDRVAAEGAAEAAGLRRIHDLGAAGDGGEGETARDALRAQHEVGHEPEVLARVVRAGAGHAALDLVGDEDDAVRRAPLLQRGQVAVGGNHEAALALDGLDDEAGEVGGADDLLEVGDRACGRIGAAEAVVVRVGARRVVDVAGERAEARAVRHGLEVHGHREVGAAVVRVVEHGDAAAAGVLAGDLDAVLDGFGAGVDQHGLLRVVAGGVLGEQLGDAHVLLVRA